LYPKSVSLASVCTNNGELACRASREALVLGRTKGVHFMQLVEPKIFLVGETRLVASGLLLYLKHIGASEWTTNAPSEAEALVED
jgi:hypothetical protein